MLNKSHLGPELHSAGIEFFLNIKIAGEFARQSRDRECKCLYMKRQRKQGEQGKIPDMCILEKEKVSRHLIV